MCAGCCSSCLLRGTGENLLRGLSVKDRLAFAFVLVLVFGIAAIVWLACGCAGGRPCFLCCRSWCMRFTIFLALFRLRLSIRYGVRVHMYSMSTE